MTDVTAITDLNGQATSCVRRLAEQFELFSTMNMFQEAVSTIRQLRRTLQIKSPVFVEFVFS